MSKNLKLFFEASLCDLASFEYTAWQQKLVRLPKPSFETHQPDLDALRVILQDAEQFGNIIIIGNGGSRTSALAFFDSLSAFRNNKRVAFLSTMEPEVIAELRANCAPHNTLVMPISKSGTNVDVLEPLLQFLDYPIIPVTSPEKGVLYDLAKIYNWPIISHPEVGGRFSGRTECGLAPAYLFGLNIESLNQGAIKAYTAFNYAAPLAANDAFLAALICYQHERLGIDQIFMPIYSRALSGFLPLIIQLIHESTGKLGLGQTIFGDQAPESQHHTNQRFFGGPRNVLGFFMTVKNHAPHIVTKVPAKIKTLSLREGTLADLDGIPLYTALHFDYAGVAEEATKNNIPHLTLEVNEVTPESMGELLSFWHFFAVYSAFLREQDPFDQPEVEAAKDISFKKRQQFKR